jgi:TonB family protein
MAAVLAVAVAVGPLYLQAVTELEQHLRDQYLGKTLLLRNFYGGNSLRYDGTGQLPKAATPGDWTVDGFVQVDDVEVSSRHLTIRAKRVHLGWFPEVGFSPVEDAKDKDKADKQEDARSLRIEVDLGLATSEAADSALSQIFLTPQDHFAELVPDYWKPCVLAASTGKNGKPYDACRFPPEFAAIPGVVYNLEEAQKSGGKGEAKGSEAPATRIGKGVTPPRVIYQKDPELSKQARRAKYQGTVLLSVVVDKSGHARNIQIVRPLGFGLDQKAVENVSKWQFSPPTKDGKPVELQIAVEVDFQLH